MTADDGGCVIVRDKIYCRPYRTGDVGCGVDEKVLHTSRVHAYVHTLKYECLLTFLTNDNMTMYNIYHITPIFSPLTYLKRCATTRL